MLRISSRSHRASAAAERELKASVLALIHEVEREIVPGRERLEAILEAINDPAGCSEEIEILEREIGAAGLLQCCFESARWAMDRCPLPIPSLLPHVWGDTPTPLHRAELEAGRHALKSSVAVDWPRSTDYCPDRRNMWVEAEEIGRRLSVESCRAGSPRLHRCDTLFWCLFLFLFAVFLRSAGSCKEIFQIVPRCLDLLFELNVTEIAKSLFPELFFPYFPLHLHSRTGVFWLTEWNRRGDHDGRDLF
jgi:hypothetical protein